jgi:hypothetical protein
MRRSFPVLLLAALALTACSHGNSSSSSTSNTSGTTSSQTQAPGTSPASASPAATASAAAAPLANSAIPTYPGAAAMMTGSANGTSTSILTTKDSFDTVYAWYKGHLPAGSEAEKITTGNVQEVVFKVGDSAVSITSSNDQTEITIANKTP